MIGSLIAFELRRRLKMLSTYVYAVVLFAAGLFLMLVSGGVFNKMSASSGNERVLANSPYELFNFVGIIALLGLFTVGAIFGQAAYQDFGHDTWMLVFTKNVKKTSYLLGRFLGAFAFAAVLFTAIGFGELFGSAIVYFVHPERLGPTSAIAYLWPYLTQVWPMLFFTGTVFFALAALTRKMAPVYVGLVVLVLGYLLATVLAKDVQNQTLASLLDPFGFFAAELVTRYWTPAERNRDLMPLVGMLGTNRLLWTTVGMAVLGIAIARFRTTVDEHKGRAAAADELGPSTPLRDARDERVPFPKVQADPSARGWGRASAAMAWMYFREVTRSPVYWTLVLSGLVFLTIAATSSGQGMFGTTTWPVTYRALELALGSFRLFSIITIVLYAGELAFRERDVGAQDIVDATRAPTWVAFLGRLGALLLIALSLESVAGLAALATQLGRGYFAIEWRLYAMELLVLDFTYAALVCVLALVVQVVVNHKYLGHFAMVGYYVMQPVLAYVGVEDRLTRYASSPDAKYSDLNGYGHFLGPVLWFRIYWTGAAVLLVVIAYLFTVRGRETSWARRRAQVGPRFTAAWRATAVLGAVAFAGAGAFCFQNTHILHRYLTEKDQERLQAQYERRYKAFADLPQPRVTAVDVKIDIFPSKRELTALGSYRVKNKGQAPVTRVLLNLPDDVEVRELTIAGARTPAADSDVKNGVFVFDLPQPLAPDAEADLRFDLRFFERGFRHKGARTDIVENGTFFNSGNFPIIGYYEAGELTEDSDRKEYGFAPKERMAPRDDQRHRQQNYITPDSDFVSFKATVSTDPAQIAIAPGYLEKTWEEGGRPHFQFAMDQPILNFYSVLSARYAVTRDEWNGIKLEIYHHPSHTKNLDRMMAGMKDALKYCSENFGPYQHRQARIIEFPRYATFAQSFPNTIPYSEGIGFIARVRDDDPDDVDYPYYVTAHEIAHQWWAHQVVGAAVRGATMTSESMAQYSALMVLKHKYGPEKMRRFLKFELDGYLVGRVVTERKKELPLAQNENQQYVHYQKASVVMYALQSFIGEDRVNRALKKYVEAVKFRGPPYTTSADLIGFIREEIPPEYAYLIDDLFETITLYDNRTESASMKKNAAGGYDVTLSVKAQKYRNDEQGEQTELDFNDWMDVGALDDKGVALALERRRVPKGSSKITFTVATKPAQVGIDPLNTLVDRNSGDNVKAPTLED